MAYVVKITLRAERDLTQLFEAINAVHSEAALEWYRNLKAAILSLREQPNRCSEVWGRVGLRHLLYGRKPHIYRVIFRILERQKCVEVLHIRHGARQKLKPSDLK
jgi:plasmid stabilization system protein ParE